jgi:nucleoside-diphosphate-sugar epimerase
VPRLQQRGDTVRALVRTREQADASDAAEAAIGDLLRPETLAPAVTDVDAVVHLAAFFRGATPAQAWDVNMAGTRHLAQAAIDAGVPRFIFISTNLVYGPGRGRPAIEDDMPRPQGGYPAGKAEAEQALGEMYQANGLGLRVLRLAFVYGDGDPHLAEVVPLLRAWPSSKRLQMVHHADVAQAVMLTADTPGIDGRTYNVADDVPIPAAEIRSLNGLPAGDDQADAPDDQFEGIVDTTRIRGELGFRPIYPSLFVAREAGAL